MATRHERVVLTLEDNFTTSAAKAAAATALINRELRNLSGAAVGTHRPLRTTAGEVDKVSSATRRADRDLDRYSGRLTILRDLALTIGPALAPIGAVAVPAITGLAAQFGAAALAGGTAIVAFQGVGDALTALNEAALEPTEENLEKARVALANISPEAQRFVRELQAMRPALRDLRDAGAAGLFPGLIDGLDEIEGVLPNIERLLFAVGDATGELGADLGEALNSERGREFLEFLRTEIPSTLTRLGTAVGNVAAGLGELWIAFTPLNRDFSGFLMEAAAGFDEWASGLAETEGFQDFIDYVRVNGPRVGEALSSIGSALLSIVEAAAPLGGPVLEALTAVADVIKVIADSPAGPVLLTTATALALLSRSQKAFGTVAQSSWGQAIRGAQGYEKRVRAIRTTALRGGAAIGGLAIAASAAGEGFALSNTASLALMGTLGGPWGAAVGGAVGLMLDLSDSSDKFRINSDDLIATLDEQTGAITRNTSAFVANEFEKAGVLEAAQDLGLNLKDVTDAALGYPDALNRVTRAIAEAKGELFDDQGTPIVGTDQLRAFRDNMFLVEDAIGASSSSLQDAQGEFHRLELATDDSTRGLERVSDGLKDSKVAADNFRDAIDKLNRVLSGRASQRDYEQALDDFAARAVERAEVLDELAQARRDFANADTKSERRSAADRIDSLEEEAEALRNTLDIGTQAGRDTQAALDNIATNALEVAETLRGTAKEEFLRRARRDLIRAAEEAGLTERAAKKLADRLGLLDDLNAKPTVEIGGYDVFLDRAREMELALERIKSRTVTVNTIYTSSGRRFKDGFYSGGWTGDMDPRRIAGVVHGREVVIPAWLAKRDASMLRSRYGFLPGMENLRGYAKGGFVDSRVYDQRTYHSTAASAGGGAPIDYGQLAQAMAALQPQGQLFGDVTIKGDPAAFKRELQREKARRGAGGF